MDQVKIYLTSDTHWGHQKIIEYCNRPDNYDQLIINHWKAIVAPQDIIYHLGDVIWGNKQKLTEIMSDLPGRKFLIKGNHDVMHSDNWFYDAGFQGVFSEVTIRMFGNRYRLSHFPINVAGTKDINIHGHLHNAKYKNWEGIYKEIISENNYLLALEYVDYSPVLLETAIKNKKVIPTELRKD